MVENNIDGPYTFNDVGLFGNYLGSGAQFSVQGQQHAATKNCPPFDQPYISPQVVNLSSRFRPVVVAIKRPVFTLGWGKSDGEQAPKVGFGTPAQLYSLELEIVTLCNTSIRSHRNIVKLVAWGIDESTSSYGDLKPFNLLLILEHGNCSLRQFLAAEKGSIPWQVLRALTLDISQGLSVLHAASVIHGDLKTDNILVFPDRTGPFFCVAKLSDFGLSVTDQQDQRERVFSIGTPGWQAPELPNDEGIAADMLFKCDHFSLGMVIFSTIFNFGLAPPVAGPQARFTLESVRSKLSRSRIPKSAIDRIECALESLLQLNPSDRPSNLENICCMLAHAEESVFDKRGAWINGRFDNNIPWGELRASTAKTAMLGMTTRFTRALPLPDQTCLSWQSIYTFLHQCSESTYNLIAAFYLNNIHAVIAQRSPEDNLSTDVVGDDITGAQLLALCFNERLPPTIDSSYLFRLKRGSCAAVAATKGYFPAQAVASILLEGTSSKVLGLVRTNYAKWQWNAVSTGYLLAWNFASESPDEHESALRHFRSRGGYNMHYTYPQPYAKAKRVYSSSGLPHDPLAELSAYPLHHAAVLDDVVKIESLLQHYPVDSSAGIGDTALHMACMAGAFNAVCFLIEHGADPSIKSKRFGTVPLHWLFLFQSCHVRKTALVLTANKSVLNEVSDPGIEAFHCPFVWPEGTPLEWAVLSNHTEAISVLLDLGCTQESIQDFCLPCRPSPAHNPPPSVNPTEDNSHVYRNIWRTHIYYAMEKHRSPVVQRHPSYQNQLNHLQAEGRRLSIVRNPDTVRVSKGCLHDAAREGDFGLVAQLIALGADVNELLEYKDTPLLTAIRAGYPDVIHLLLDKGARLDTAGHFGVLPLHRAAIIGHLGTVKLLLDRGADVDAVCFGSSVRRRSTALAEALEVGHTEVVRLLLECGANPLKLVDGHEICLEAAVYNHMLEFVDLFLKWGANPNTIGRLAHVGNALIHAAHDANATIISSLLKHGADPNIQAGPFLTALQAALNPAMHRMWRGQRNVVQLLLENSAKVDVYGGEYGSVLQAAACSADIVLVRHLLDAGAPVNLGGGPHGCALNAAVSWNNDLEMIQLLLAYGADPNPIDNRHAKHESALSLAVKKGNEKQVELLLRAGAIPNRNGTATRATTLDPAGTPTGEDRISQMLYYWSEKDNVELDQWNLMISHISRPNLTEVRPLLKRRLRTSRRYPPGLKSMAEIITKIIDFAEFWPATLTERHEKTELSMDTVGPPYLQVNVENWAGMEMTVQRIVFRIKSHTSKPQKLPATTPNGHEGDGYPQLEIAVRSGRSSSLSDDQMAQPTETIFCCPLTELTNCIIWDSRSPAPGVSELTGSLKVGDTLDVYVKSKEGEVRSGSYVDSAEVIIYYDDRSTPIPIPPMAEHCETGQDHNTVQRVQSPVQVAQNIAEEPHPHRIHNNFTENSKLKEKTKMDEKNGALRRVVGFFTDCFK